MIRAWEIVKETSPVWLTALAVAAAIWSASSCR